MSTSSGAKGKHGSPGARLQQLGNKDMGVGAHGRFKQAPTWTSEAGRHTATRQSLFAYELTVKTVLNSKRHEYDTDLCCLAAFPFKCSFLRYSLLSLVRVQATVVKSHFPKHVFQTFLFLLTASIAAWLFFHSNPLQQRRITEDISYSHWKNHHARSACNRYVAHKLI